MYFGHVMFADRGVWCFTVWINLIRFGSQLVLLLITASISITWFQACKKLWQIRDCLAPCRLLCIQKWVDCVCVCVCVYMTVSLFHNWNEKCFSPSPHPTVFTWMPRHHFLSNTVFIYSCFMIITPVVQISINLLKTKCNLLYIRNQYVPRCKRFAPQLWKPFS
jgi:hypothetical protein